MSTIRYIPFVGRLMIGLPFAMSGLGKLAAYGATTAMISAAGLPLPPLGTRRAGPANSTDHRQTAAGSVHYADSQAQEAEDLGRPAGDGFQGS